MNRAGSFLGCAGRTVAASFFLAVSATGALACSPGFITPSAVPVAGPNCALRLDLDETDSVSLGETVRTPAGLIVQTLSNGNGCYARFNLLVHDCATGQVMVIGTERFDLMSTLDQRGPPPQTGLERIRARALTAGGPQDLAGFAALSASEGYGDPVVMRTNQSLRFGNRTLPVACACQTAARGG